MATSNLITHLGWAGCLFFLLQTPSAHAETDLSLGRQVYQQHCARCHNFGANNAPMLGNVADWAPRTPEWKAVHKSHATHGFLLMPAKGGNPALSDTEIEAAVDYMLAEINVAESDPITSDLTRGREVYFFNCAACHDKGVRGAPKIGHRADWARRTPQGNAVLKQHAEQGLMLMPPKGNNPELSTQDVEAAVDYMLHWLRMQSH